jgi:hypothetical protein
MSFKGQLEAFARKADNNMAMATKKVLIDIGARIVERTPVGDPTLWSSPAPKGYVGGRARGSWQYSINVPAAGDPGTIDPAGSATIAAITSKINPVPAIHYISSNLPYMQALENGWSSQAPAGMVGLVAVEFSNIVDVAVRSLNK